MDRHAKKLQSVRDEGKFGDENFPDPSDEEDTEKEVRDIFIGEMEEEVFFHSSFNILSFIHSFINSSFHTFINLFQCLGSI